jgi:hypothetical protein
MPPSIAALGISNTAAASQTVGAGASLQQRHVDSLNTPLLGQSEHTNQGCVQIVKNTYITRKNIA